MYALPDQPSPIGRILDAGIKLFTVVFPKVIPIALIMGVLLAVINYLFNSGGSFGVLNVVALLVVMVINSVCLSAMIYRIGNQANNVEDNMGDSINVGLRKFLPFFLASLLYMVAMMLGMVLLIIPGIYVAVALSLFVYLLVNEDQGVVGSLTQSHALVKGNWWRTFIVTMVPALLIGVANFAVAFILTMALGVNEHGVSPIAASVSQLISALAYPFFYSVGYVLFNDLKLSHSGSDLEARLGA